MVVQAAERDAEEPTPAFLRALLRSASSQASEASSAGLEVEGVPSVPVGRPALSRTHAGLLCGHVAPRPLVKALPPRLPCLGCSEGRPTDRELVEAAIADSSAEERERYLELLTGSARAG